MQCRQIRSKSAAFLDGDLHPAGRLAFTEHLATCDACAEEVGAVAEFLQDCREALTCPGTAYSFDTLRARMACVTPLEEVRNFLPKLRVEKPVPRFAVAATLLALTLLLPLFQRGARTVYTNAEEPFKFQAARIDAAYQEFLGESAVVNEAPRETPFKA